MTCADRYGLRLTGGVDAMAAYNRGVASLLRLEEGFAAEAQLTEIWEPFTDTFFSESGD